MKRIANDVALATILYFVGGLQKIKVIDLDRKTRYSYNYINRNCGEGKVIFDGMLKDKRYDTFDYKHEHAKIVGIETDGDVLVLYICTEDDTF